MLWRLAFLAQVASECVTPVKKAPVVFPPDLLHDDPSESMFSGYVNVTAEDYLFYWFVEAKDAKDAPIILWSNGGPGCTSMEGATTEIGPMLLKGVKTRNGYTGRLSSNPFRWNQRAHVIFVDQPRYVGFSTGKGPFVLTSQDAALDMVRFIRGWRLLFPHLAKSKWILASESYGGHYVPAWSEAIFDFNREHPAEAIWIGGVLLSNACIDDKHQGFESFKKFAHQEGILPMVAEPDTMPSAMFQIWDALEYMPNSYDYRRRAADPCCGCMGYNYSEFDRWFSSKALRKALNVCGDAGADSFGSCGAGCVTFPKAFDAEHRADNVATLSKLLHMKIPVTMIYGMKDATCNYVGGYNIASSLKWPKAAEWSRASMTPVTVDAEIEGSMKSGGGLTWLQIANAGHMNPADNPKAALFAISQLLDDFAGRTQLREFEQRSNLLRSKASLWPCLALAGAIFFVSISVRFFRCRRLREDALYENVLEPEA